MGDQCEADVWLVKISLRREDLSQDWHRLQISFSDRKFLKLVYDMPYGFKDGRYSGVTRVSEVSWCDLWSWRRHAEMAFCAIKDDQGVPVLSIDLHSQAREVLS